MYSETEDLVCDVISKAQRGLNISDIELQAKADISSGELAEIKKLHKEFSPKILTRIAKALHLNEKALVALSEGWLPKPVSVKGLKQVPTAFYGSFVNAYVVWDPTSKIACIFDTGMKPEPLLEFIDQHKLHPKAIFLTHAHTDHIACLPAIQNAFKNIPTYIHENEIIASATPFQSLNLSFSNLKVTTQLTAGHSPGGTTYLIEGLEKPIAIVGDALFAASQGGTSPAHYQEALNNNLSRIYSLPNNTIICPGHGPLTTVQEEKQFNCFYLPNK